MAAAAAVTGSLLLTVGCSSSNSSSGSASGNTGSGTNWATEVVENGNGIVTTRTFLGSVTRVGVQLSGDVAVQVDRPSAEAAALAPGASVAVSLPAQPVLVAARRVS
jgi:hypothetical protein